MGRRRLVGRMRRRRPVDPGWPPFPDSAEALAYLKTRDKLAILSNVDNESFAASNAKLGVAFDAIYTAEDVGAYKPSSRNFEDMLANLATLDIERNQTRTRPRVSFHDHVSANAHGLATAWIYRRHGETGFGATINPGKTPKIDFRFNSMAELAAAVRETAA